MKKNDNNKSNVVLPFIDLPPLVNQWPDEKRVIKQKYYKHNYLERSRKK
jgi:hypothetical protein